MKKLISMIVVCTLVLGLGVPALASGYSTTASYVGTAAEEITITVPASLIAGGDAGYVTVSGAWPANKVVSISAPSLVTLTNSLTTAEANAAIDFDGIALGGSDTGTVSTSEEISVATPIPKGVENVMENAVVMFGAWTGTFNYMVSVDYSVETGATLANTSWQFREDLSGYEGIFGDFDFEEQTGWEPFPYTSTIGNDTLSYNFWGFSNTYLNGVPIFGPVQSISEERVFGYAPGGVAGVQSGWYIIDGEMLTAWLEETPYGSGNVEVTPEYIIANGITPTTAPTITIGEVNRGDYSDDAEGEAEYQAVVDALKKSEVINWLYKNAEVQAYVPAPIA